DAESLDERTRGRCWADDTRPRCFSRRAVLRERSVASRGGVTSGAGSARVPWAGGCHHPPRYAIRMVRRTEKTGSPIPERLRFRRATRGAVQSNRELVIDGAAAAEDARAAGVQDVLRRDEHRGFRARCARGLGATG